jgi:hypothetical protein
VIEFKLIGQNAAQDAILLFFCGALALLAKQRPVDR